MGTRGRTSGAALSVVACRVIDGRPAPPSSMPAFQRQVWERTVANEAADMFSTAALQQLLTEYCRHVDAASKLEKQVQLGMAAGANVDLEALDRLLKMRDRETKALAQVATKLRLTNQSRYVPRAAATAAKKAKEAKPWQMAG